MFKKTAKIVLFTILIILVLGLILGIAVRIIFFDSVKVSGRCIIYVDDYDEFYLHKKDITIRPFLNIPGIGAQPGYKIWFTRSQKGRLLDKIKEDVIIELENILENYSDDIKDYEISDDFKKIYIYCEKDAINFELNPESARRIWHLEYELKQRTIALKIELYHQFVNGYLRTSLSSIINFIEVESDLGMANPNADEILKLKAFAEFEDNAQKLGWDPEKYEIIMNKLTGDRMGYATIDRLEKAIKSNPMGIIVECKVIGGGVSRVVKVHNSKVVDSFRYTTSEVEITKVYFKDENVSLKEGDIIDVYEQYFYITEETPELLERYGPNHIFSNEWYPLEKGHTYIIHGQYQEYREPEPDAIHVWTEDPKDEFPRICPWFQESTFCLSVDEPAKATELVYNYREMWQEVKAKYGSSIPVE